MTILTGLAAHLSNAGLLEATVASQALLCSKQQNISFVRYLVKNKIMASQSIANFCSTHFNLPLVDLFKFTNLSNNKWLSTELMLRYEMVPLEISATRIKLALVDPTDQQAIKAAMFYTSLSVSPVTVAFDQLQRFLDSQNFQIDKRLWDELRDDPPVAKEHQENYDEPLIRLVDNLINHALQRAASDIHIEPYEHHCRIRYRQQGLLHEINQLPKKLSDRLITRLKVLAKLDISERRLPQDGRLRHHHTDIRISTCPTLFGEKLVLRLLDTNNFQFEISSLGMNTQQQEIFLKKISKPQGMILVTGPTGSGKTVTLYSALHFLNQTNKNISTVEDPVEINLTGINQVTIQPKIGLTFSTVLRTFLRQDPDVIMLGEIRDAETAETAIQAAQTGHLVFSTLHTNCALETLTRLSAMNIPAYHIASSISLVIAQRLIRILCTHCKHAELIPPFTASLAQHHPIHAYRAIGCHHCIQGYQGRIGIYEMLSITTHLAQLIINHNDYKKIEYEAKQEGFRSLQENGLKLVTNGVTSLAELNRVINL